MLSPEVTVIAVCDRETSLACTKMMHQRVLWPCSESRAGMTHLLSGLVNADGRIAILGFYDGVRAQRNMNRRLPQRLPLMLTRSSTIMFTTIGLPENVCVLPGERNRGWARMGADNGDMDAKPVFQCNAIY
jgi:hypothetical protein